MMRHAVLLLAAVALTAACGGAPAADTLTPATVSSTTVETTTTTAEPTTTTPAASITTPTTRLLDVEPPVLAVTAPGEGASLTTRAVGFEGVTEPGATVVAWDRWAAEVADDGTWSIVLMLNPGTNIAQFTATDPAGNTTSVESVVSYTPPTTTTQPGNFAETTVITYKPTVIPEEHHEGYCDYGSHLTDRDGAWRCWRTDAEGGIYDPCFHTGTEVVCDASPISGDPGFVLDLTRPLPQDRVPGDPTPWILELFDGTYCYAISGATGSQLGVRVHYLCGDGTWVLEDVRSGKVWTGHRLILTEPPDRAIAEDLGFVPIRTIWQ